MRRMGRGGSWFELKRARARNAQPQRTRARCGCDVTFHLVLLIAVVCDCPLLHHPPPMCVPSSSLCRDDAVIIQGTSMAISSPMDCRHSDSKNDQQLNPLASKKVHKQHRKSAIKLCSAPHETPKRHTRTQPPLVVSTRLFSHTRPCHRELPLLAAGKLRQAAAECGGAGAGVGWCCVGFKTLH